MAWKLSARIESVGFSPTLSLNARVKELVKSGEDVVNFAVGEPDFDTPNHIKEEAVKALEEGFTKYTPVGGIAKLKEAIARKFLTDNNLHYTPEEILVSCGAKHSLFNFFQVILNPGDEVIIPSPYWVSYPEQVRLAGGVPRIIPTREENSFKIEPSQLYQTINSRTRALVLNSPSNPTGVMYNHQELKEIAEVIVKKDILVISDEVYEKIIYDNNRHFSIGSLNEEIRKRTVTVNGVSKAYSMTGWRIGYAGGPREIIKAMEKVQSQSTSNPSSLSQRAALAALTQPQDSVELMVKEFQKRRDYLVGRIGKVPSLTFILPQGTFYLFLNVKFYLGRTFRQTPVNSSLQLAQFLLEEGRVAVVPGIAFGSEGYLRLSYSTSLERLGEGWDRIKKLLG